MAALAQAQVPADIEAQLIKIGHIVDPACTAKLYRPLMPANDINSNVTPLYPGVAIVRDASFGPNPKDIVDIFSPQKGGGSRPVLMYIPGGAGNKIEQQNREANAFMDNIGWWGVKNGMVVVIMQRHPGQSWDDPGRDVSKMVQWVQENIAKYKGNPNRMFIWAQSAGNGPLGTYVGRPELWGPKGVGVVGAIFMSGQFNIAPLQVPGAGRGPAPNEPGGIFYGAGQTCGSGGPNANTGLINGPGRAGGGAEGGRGAAEGGRGGAPAAPPDAATLEARSSLPEFRKTKVKLLFASAELDPGVNRDMAPFFKTLHDDICQHNPSNCPTMLYEKGESHMSEVFGIGTADQTVSGPILAWMKKVK
jgi:hypothetical protein